MQGEGRGRHPPGGEAVEQSRRRSEGGGGRGHRPRPLRVHRLVALRVRRFGGAPEIGGKRDLAEVIQHLIGRPVEIDAVELSSRPAHTPRTPEPSSTSPPDFSPLLARTLASSRLRPSMRSTNTSTRPPVGLRPRSLARMTRVSLSTSRSPGRK